MALTANSSSPMPLQEGSGNKLAILGGKPVRPGPFPSWPKIGDNEGKAWMAVLRKKEWCRLGVTPSYVTNLEEAWKKMTGAEYCLATASGTTALFTCLNALEIGPGDEVLVPPYTFVATINVVFLQHALPIFVDTDRDTFQMDSRKIEAAVTPQTRCILPVHMGGSAADMDTILAVGKKHKLAVLEDACQAHLAEWRNRKLGTLGDLGCFSFQASKNANCGEGGAILSNNLALIERCMSFHNNGRAPKEGYKFAYIVNGSNHRMTEFQGALFLEQVTRLEEQSRTREQNAAYLNKLLREIPGITPARMYDGCTRNAWHVFMLRYDKNHFAGLPRSRFLAALEAEGISNMAGYSPLNKEAFIKATLDSRSYKRIYSSKELAAYEERNHCPENDKLCEEAVFFYQAMFLGTKQDMDQIAEAIRKIQKQAPELLSRS